MNELVSAEWLRALASLVENGTVSVLKCELQPRGILLGVVEPRQGPTVRPVKRPK